MPAWALHSAAVTLLSASRAQPLARGPGRPPALGAGGPSDASWHTAQAWPLEPCGHPWEEAALHKT